MMITDRLAIICYPNNLLIVLLLCLNCVTCYVTNTNTKEAYCPFNDIKSTTEPVQSIECQCRHISVDCFLEPDFVENSSAWTEFSHLTEASEIVKLAPYPGVKLINFPTQLFPNLAPPITQIILAHWRFQSIPSFKVPITSKVKILTIELNDNFDYLGPKVFNPLSEHLEKLALRSNAHSNIDPAAFHGLKNINDISLTNNNLSVLPDDIFIDSPRLTNLSLSTNKITFLRRAIFHGLSNLDYLDLDENDLLIIQNNTFAELKHLKSLILSHNKIDTLEVSAFNGLNSIEFIDLSDNNLRFFPLEVFGNLKTLTEIDLKRNSLASLSDGFLSKLPKTFYLKGNEWTCDCSLLFYVDKVLVDNGEVKCTATFVEFNETDKPVKPKELTFSEYIKHVNHTGTCDELSNNIKEKRSNSRLTLASTSEAGQSSSSVSSGYTLNTLIVIIALNLLAILKVT